VTDDDEVVSSLEKFVAGAAIELGVGGATMEVELAEVAEDDGASLAFPMDELVVSSEGGGVLGRAPLAGAMGEGMGLVGESGVG